MLTQNHHYLFQSSVACAFANAIDGAFYLPGAVRNARDGIGGGQSEIIMTMRGENRFFDAFYVFIQVFDFGTVLIGQAITRCVRDI